MKNIEISWYGLHFGEEPPISGTKGSGTIFFCRCNLKCVFCQNWQISQECKGCKKYSPNEVVRMMLNLQNKGAHNINLVSPTIWSFWLKEILIKAKEEGLKIPVIWNSNGYENIGVLGGFKSLVDIYLPDYKYDNEKLAIKYSSATNYPEVAKKAILEMQRQVGDLVLDKNGIAKKGLIVRHLVLPDNLENSKRCLKFIRSISPGIHLSLLSQYNPVYKAKEFSEINRPITKKEFAKVKRYINEFNFKHGWIQEFGKPVKYLTPDFGKKSPFNWEV